MQYTIGIAGKVLDHEGKDVGFCVYAPSHTDFRVYHRSPITKCDLTYNRSGITLVLNNGDRLTGYYDMVSGLIDSKAFELKYGLPGRILTVQ